MLKLNSKHSPLHNRFMICAGLKANIIDVKWKLSEPNTGIWLAKLEKLQLALDARFTDSSERYYTIRKENIANFRKIPVGNTKMPVW